MKEELKRCEAINNIKGSCVSISVISSCWKPPAEAALAAEKRQCCEGTDIGEMW